LGKYAENHRSLGVVGLTTTKYCCTYQKKIVAAYTDGIQKITEMQKYQPIDF